MILRGARSRREPARGGRRGGIVGIRCWNLEVDYGLKGFAQ